ncbi:MAG: SdrD B-like domain-containing protein [bacterium]|nr:SdrD B-like domain-containing protein [bacterium]
MMKRQRGNAVLFSLLIMGSALVASAGMATLVTGEIANVSLIPPSEHAYYKTESYVEQGLWQKKQDPEYQIENKSELPANFLCTGNCFETAPRNQAGSLITYESTTSVPDGQLALTQDKVVQLDIDTSDTTGSTGRFDLGSIKAASGLRGVEVTVIAYPKQAPFTDITGASGGSVETPVFVETRLFTPGMTGLQLITNLGPPETNRLGEQFPPLNTSFYRLRIKALGADTVVQPTAIANPNTSLLLLTPDFRVTAVAEDGRARRGIEVLVPATEQIASVFDFVIFSDLALSKTDAKQQRIKSLKVKVYDDANRNCVKDAGEAGQPGVAVSAGSAYSASTDADGIASFPDMQPGSYTVKPTVGSGSTVCSPQTRNVTFVDDQTTEVKEAVFLVQSAQRVPWYRAYNYGSIDHWYTANKAEYDYWTTHGYTAEGIAGYLYAVQAAGTQPLYRSWNGSETTHYYTMSKSSHDYWNAHGYVSEGITGYLYPYNATDDAAGRTGCPTGSDPLYESWWPGGDHLYTMSKAEWDAVTWYVKQPIVGCMWTTAG